VVDRCRTWLTVSDVVDGCWLYCDTVTQVVGEVCKEPSQFKFDKRMTGSTAIDEVLQEVHRRHCDC